MNETTQSRPFQIRDLTDEPGFWSARLVVDGDSVEANRQFGSWQLVDRGADGSVIRRTEVLRYVAEALQKRVRRLENARAKTEIAA